MVDHKLWIKSLILSFALSLSNAQLTAELLESEARVVELEAALDQCLNPPPPPTQCSDGIDNDGDGRIDLEDRQCENSEQNSEKHPNR